jgi:hypothetical protein
MKNKLLFTTAIASGLIFSSAVLAEVKVKGDVEATYKAQSNDLAASEVDNASGLGIETNIIIQYKATLSNGMNVSAGSILEDGIADSEYLTIGGNTVSFTVGQDVGNNLSSTVVPHISDQDATLFSAFTGEIVNQQLGSETHEPLHVSLDGKVAGGTATFRYVPSMSSTQSDSGIDDSGNSAIEILYAGSLGVDGLKAQFGTARQVRATDTEANKDDLVLNKVGLSYNFGQVSVGADRQMFDNGDATNNDTTSDRFAVVFAASNDLKIGARYTVTDKDGNTADEKLKVLEVGYNLGGLGIEFAVGQIENIGGSTAAGDGEVLQIRTRQAF